VEVAARSGSTEPESPQPEIAGAQPIPVGMTPPRQGFTGRISAYVALTKPRIIELLLITTIPAMFAAQRDVPPLTLVLATLVGGTLAAGSANALNCVVDADIDAVMRRTRSRPLARHTVTPRAALIFGIVLGVLAAAELWATTTWQAAVLSRCNAAFTSLVGPSRNHSCNRGPPTPIGKSAPTFGPATKPSSDIDLLMTTLPTPPPLLLVVQPQLTASQTSQLQRST